mgnify:CR=1 FL=1
MKLVTEMYEHQRRAVEKLSKIKIGALYMEMGTGKTRATLELIKIRLEKKRIEHVIWLCPCSVKENLRRDIIKHTGEENTELITICGIETLSSSIAANLKLLELVQNKNCYLIVDESNMVKNHLAKRTKNIIRLSEYCKYKLILNGTPITRNEADLYAQWYLLDWRVLGYKSYWSFAANHLEFDDYGRLRKTLNTDYLTEKIAPYSYQIKKDECLDLPEKTYEIQYYNLTDEQDKHYEYVANKLFFYVDEIEPHTIYRMFTGLQNVISGYKVTVKEEKEEFYNQYNEKVIKSRIIGMEKSRFFESEKENPRIQKLLEIIDKIDSKILIFCKYTDEINSIVEILNEKYGEDSAIPFNGELNIKNRNKNLDKFRNGSRFLVANKSCGAYGLNLQFCNYIIYYSNDFDFGTRAQSEDRVHRIGQNKNVHIIDICAAWTLDERIINCLKKKENLVDTFKKELEEKKDEEFLYSWIRKKYSRNKKFNKMVKYIDKYDLREE